MQGLTNKVADGNCEMLANSMNDFSKALDLNNHNILLDKLQVFGISAHILRWMAAFVLDRTQQRVKIGNTYSHTGLPNGGVPQGTICGPKCFMIIYICK